MSSRRVRRPVRRRSTDARSLTSLLERLERRELLSTLPEAQPQYRLAPSVVDTSPPSGSFVPSQIRQAYQFNQVSLNGHGETIAIVDAYNDPNIQADLNTFDAQFKLASTTVTVVNQSGGTSLPASDPTGGWEMEESLDVEWAHAMAPGAKILLVEVNSASESDLLAGVNYAAKHANVVSMSWGGGEFAGETSFDGNFSVPGVAFVAASGDSGAPAEWPAASPNVLGVGGTSLTLNSSGGWGSETGWSGSGGGTSAYESKPSYQLGVVKTGTTTRDTPDVAYDGSSTGTYAVYDSAPYEVGLGVTESLGWVSIYGTSAGAPQWSAILALADQGRAAAGLPALDSSGAQQVMSILYKNPGDFHDITSGTSTGNPSFSARPGYDYVTGLGTPKVNLIVGSLDGGAGADTIAVSAPSTATAGTSFTYKVTAEKPGTTTVDTGYTGTISFASSDSKIQGLPSTFTFPASDHGVATFTVTLKTAGSRTITETSAVGSVASKITVSPAAASHFVISGLSAATAGAAKSFTVTAEDAYGNVATGYTGTVAFTSSDAAAHLPANTAFTTSNGGKRTLSVTFETTGTQSLTVTDTAHTSLKGTQSGIIVSPAAPTTESIWGTSYTPTVNAAFQGSSGQTFELGVQFESNVAGEVTGVLFYKQSGMTGTNVGHLWSSSGKQLASATFTNETSSGWQEVRFSNPVSIAANTIYTVSYTTGSPLFYLDAGYFSNGGVTHDNLTAPASTDINGLVLDNGVYNYGGYFPVASAYQANFWADVVFSPSSGSNASLGTAAGGASTGGSRAMAIGRAGDAATSTGSAAPAGPMGVLPGWRKSSSWTARRPTVGSIVVGDRPLVTRARGIVLWGRKPTPFLS